MSWLCLINAVAQGQSHEAQELIRNFPSDFRGKARSLNCGLTACCRVANAAKTPLRLLSPFPLAANLFLEIHALHVWMEEASFLLRQAMAKKPLPPPLTLTSPNSVMDPPLLSAGSCSSPASTSTEQHSTPFTPVSEVTLWGTSCGEVSSLEMATKISYPILVHPFPNLRLIKVNKRKEPDPESIPAYSNLNVSGFNEEGQLEEYAAPKDADVSLTEANKATGAPRRAEESKSVARPPDESSCLAMVPNAHSCDVAKAQSQFQAEATSSSTSAEKREHLVLEAEKGLQLGGAKKKLTPGEPLVADVLPFGHASPAARSRFPFRSWARAGPRSLDSSFCTSQASQQRGEKKKKAKFLCGIATTEGKDKRKEGKVLKRLGKKVKLPVSNLVRFFK